MSSELKVADNHMLSDSCRKGSQHLMEIILVCKKYLSGAMLKPMAISKDHDAGFRADEDPRIDGEKKRAGGSSPRKGRRYIHMAVVLGIIALLVLGGLKAVKVRRLISLVRQDLAGVQEITSGPLPRMEQLKVLDSELDVLRNDFSKLKAETESFYWLGPLLGWSPVYGGELSSIRDLVTVADSMLACADIVYQTNLPLMDKDELYSLGPAQLTDLLLQAQPQLLNAQIRLDDALAARSRLDPDQLSPEVRDLLIADVDPLIMLMQDGLAVAIDLPRLMGATNEGPKTYLLLLQNEDELRPTGGFITAAGTLLIEDGRLGKLKFQSSEFFDNWDRPYPVAPWQLSQYMNSRVLTFRDTNWFTHYPTAALYAEYLYSYSNSHSVDGVIAFDQRMLIETLRVTGPVAVEDVSYLIDAENVTAYMRAAKKPSAADLAGDDWNNKIFINKLAQALFTKVLSGEVSWEPLVAVMLKSLEERHLLLQFDSYAMTAVLDRRHWDGAVRPGDGDFLMVVDSNIGFNKTNAVVESGFAYDVDLTDLQSPTASLAVFHKNNAATIPLCKHWNKVRVPGEEEYPITDCYWDYLRIYKKAGTELAGAAPQFVPDGWMILRQKEQGRVDVLSEEIEGVQGFGTLKVLMGGESLSTGFEFLLPEDILDSMPGSSKLNYHLKVQKQPGTSGVPISIRIHLPKNAVLESMPGGAVNQDNNILFETSLRTDLEFDVTFSMP